MNGKVEGRKHPKMLVKALETDLEAVRGQRSKNQRANGADIEANLGTNQRRKAGVS